jgi:hypothetical protein
MNDDRPRTRRWHRGPKGADLIDLVFKISSKDGWSATLRNNPSVVLVAEDGYELGELSRELGPGDPPASLPGNPERDESRREGTARTRLAVSRAGLRQR